MTQPKAITIVTENPDINTDKVVVTPSGEPNIIFTYINPIVGMLVRTARTFLQSWLGIVTAGMAAKTMDVGQVFPAMDFYTLALVALSGSVAAAVITFVQNLIELLGNLNEKFPKLMG